MFILTYTVSILLMLLLPVALAILLRRRCRAPWLLFIAGALTFAGSQAVHLPLNHWLSEIGVLPASGTLAGPHLWQTALLLGLSAGLCEELARAAGYALLRRFRRYSDGLMLALGHGGLEAMLFGGVLTAATLSSLWSLRGTDLQTLQLSAEQFAALSGQMEVFTRSPWFAVVPLLERVIALGAHGVCSLLVLQAFRRRGVGYVVAAIGYHAAFDALAVFLAQQTDSLWILYTSLIALLIPGLLWAGARFRLERGAVGEARRVTPFSVEWAAFVTATRKELLQQARTKRLLIVVAVFVLFGLTSPLLAKFTPELLSSIPGAEQFADLIPEPSVADALAQYIKNLTQFGFILAVLLGMGAVAGEKERGTAALILSKPLPRWAFLLSKFVAQVAVYVLALGIAALGAYYYTFILFGPVDIGSFALLNLLLLLWLLTFVAVTLLGSVLGKSTSAAAGIGLGGAVLLLLAGSLPQVGPLAPGGLVTWASQLGAGVDPVTANGGAAAMALVIVLLSLICALAAFETQEV